MFIAALFTIARMCKQPKCPSTDEWIKKMWHIYTVEYYSAIKRNEIELFVVTWMDLESVIQSEVSQKEKNKYRVLTHLWEPRKMVQCSGGLHRLPEGVVCVESDLCLHTGFLVPAAGALAFHARLWGPS